jgi:hypothetical protein
LLHRSALLLPKSLALHQNFIPTTPEEGYDLILVTDKAGSMTSAEAALFYPTDERALDSGVQHVAPVQQPAALSLVAPLPAPPPPRVEERRDAWSELQAMFAKHADCEIRMKPEPIPTTYEGTRELYERRVGFTQDFPVDGQGNYMRIDRSDPVVSKILSDASKRGYKVRFEAACKPDEMPTSWDNKRANLEFTRREGDAPGVYRLTKSFSIG